MNTEQERADFEAWANGRCELHLVNPAGRYSSAITQFAWEAYQAGRAALQSQSMPPEISRDLLGGIVDQVFGGAIEDTTVIEDIYRVIASEFGLQSQDRKDAVRLQAMAKEWDRARRGVDSHMPIWDALCEAIGVDADGAGMRAAIDHARRVEGEGE